jgi:hypothetical protein
MQSSNRALRVCSGCSAAIPDGFESCTAMFNVVLEREYIDPAFGSAHLFTVDAFALQHSEQHSSRSNAFHLMRLCGLVEHGGNPDIRQVRRKTDRALRNTREQDYRRFPFLEPPAFRGELTVVSVLAAQTPEEHTARARAWGESVWSAWSMYHKWAREQIKQWLKG